MVFQRSIATLFSLSVFVSGAFAQGLQLEPWKDDLFALPRTLEERDNGDYRIVDYSSQKEINERDSINEKRVKNDYVSLEPVKFQKDARAKTKAGWVRHFTVGRTEGASVIVFYIHGHRGSRDQGVDDWTFGGNFNRLKNLMVRNGGLYISPDFQGFTGRGAQQIAGLIEHYKESSPNAKVILSCGSAGGQICYQLAQKDNIAAQLNGILFLGSFSSSSFVRSDAFEQRVPIYIGHGSRDYISLVENLESFYRSIRARDSGYPIKMVRFETGTHGTPIRMTDWRGVLNWMLSVK